ncbi:PP2C family protein-serine/threonine phosphatase [Kitasatospora sp. NPDC050543]|uniref:PP2C family protein-serine/threonine phosphatase n=1 Tax=Kitasatospora sp. NPDC050543 TaxID=3364054 RepID=UPI003796124B
MDPKDRSARPDVPDPGHRVEDEMDRIVGRLRDLAHAQRRFQDLLDAVMAAGRELDLPVVLRRLITTAMGLVDARYGALGVLSEDGEHLEDFIPVGLSDRETSDLAGVALPHGRGLLGHLIDHPEPLRVADIGAHPQSVGFPPGHPPMQTLLGVAITSRGRVYGNLYLTERRDGRPFDRHDQDIVVALAGAAGLAIENARLYRQVRANAEYFQRLLLPQLPALDPFETAAVYRPSAAPDHVGGDWYDALMLPDGACALVIGDVVGHDLKAAATMAQTRNMLRALLYDRRTPPSAILTQLDRTLNAITGPRHVLVVELVRLRRFPPQLPGHGSRSGSPTQGRHRRPLVVLGVDQRAPEHLEHIGAGREHQGWNILGEELNHRHHGHGVRPDHRASACRVVVVRRGACRPPLVSRPQSAVHQGSSPTGRGHLHAGTAEWWIEHAAPGPGSGPQYRGAAAER